MTTPGSEHLFQRWGHSFEEDHDDVTVYRPAGHAFPRARGRDGIEFHRDGTVVVWAVGRGDAPEARPGTWQEAGSGELRVLAGGRPRLLEVVDVGPDRLEVRRR